MSRGPGKSVEVSVFVDVTPPREATTDHAGHTTARWAGRLTRAGLPLLSLLVFFGVWQLAAACEICRRLIRDRSGGRWESC